jgi:transposase
MARYKDYNPAQDRFIAVSFRDQIIPGSFEHTLCEVIDHHVDMTPFETRYNNDVTGRLAYDPAVLLKIVLYGYYKGLISSRRIADACEVNVIFMALSADTRPHFTTIANFVAKMHREIASVFTDILIYAYALNLIGKDTFAIDGCKLPSNASKEWSPRTSCPLATFVHPGNSSGTFYELKHKQKKLQTVANSIIERHRARDDKEKNSPIAIADEKKRETYERKLEKIKTFISTQKENIGPSGKERKSNITDPLPAIAPAWRVYRTSCT